MTYLLWFVLPDSANICIPNFPKLASNHEMTHSILKLNLLALTYFKMYNRIHIQQIGLKIVQKFKRIDFQLILKIILMAVKFIISDK